LPWQFAVKTFFLCFIPVSAAGVTWLLFARRRWPWHGLLLCALGAFVYLGARSRFFAPINFDEGVCRITVERSLFGFSVFQTTSHNVTLQNGKLTASNNGGKIGRMPIHPELMKYCDILFADLWGALDSEKKLVSKMGTIEFHPKTVILTPKEAAPPPAPPPAASPPAPPPGT
jgi:hypothetical protein